MKGHDQNWPQRVRHLPVCPKRGLPIPYSTARNADGTGRYEANDVARKIQCGRERLCGLCGLPLGWWLVFLGEDRGVPQAKTVFSDAPLHEACAQVSVGLCAEAPVGLCPYISRPRVPRRGGANTAAPARFDGGAPKTGWVMLVTRSYRMVSQPARGGGTVVAFRPGRAVRIRRFFYDAGGVLQEQKEKE